MKKITLPTLLALLLSFFSVNSFAQDGYTYTLAHHGGYDFTVQAVPNTSANAFATSVQSYGFTIILPDGITATITSSLGNSADATPFDGTAVGDSTIDGYLITETLGNPISLLAPSLATNSDMVSFTVNGTPTSGELKILENNSALANAVTPLKSFMSADMIDDSMALFPPVVDANAAAVSGMNTFNFSVLSIIERELLDVMIYPNPVKDTLNIRAITDLTSVEVFNINGQIVKTYNSNLEAINMSNINSGVYFVKLTTANASKTIKVIKE
ncbi:MAG: T9SS type A sorting domain-containing protein [Winogradskyella sp.]|nr:MAG: T9SS type A sorting domain-containing protein [Winogradskyella sp.]